MARDAADNALVTFELAQELLEFQDDQKDYVQWFINAVSSTIESHCGRILKAQDIADELHDGDGGAVIVLKEYPVNSVTEVILDSSREFDSEDALDSSDYGLRSGMIRLYDYETPIGMDTVQVTYNAGYATVPDDLQQACLEAVAWNVARFQGGVGIEQQSAGGITIRQEMELPLSVVQKLSRYMRSPVGAL